MNLTLLRQVHKHWRDSLQARIGGLTVLGLMLSMAAIQAQTFNTIKSFGILTNITGNLPVSTLVQELDGTLYGTTFYAEGLVAGTVYKLQPDGSGFSVLKFFTNSVEG